MSYIANTIDRPLTDYLGEYLSVLAFGAVGDGSTDDAPAINKAITTAVGLGGKDLYLPGGKIYQIKTPILFPAGAKNIRLVGDGVATVIRRGADMPDGKGMFEITGAQNITFKSLLVDGNVLTSVGVQYGTFRTNNLDDPMYPTLVKNTTFWVKGGSHLRWQDAHIVHTGGYALLLDATTSNIDGIKILDCTLSNNRPHLFGDVPSDLTYGSWTGGIHLQGNGTSFAVNNTLVRGCTFRRITGHGVWSHAYALNKAHSNLRIIGNYFEDIGLDGIQYGVVTGGVADSNVMRRIGYVTFDDNGQSQPKWIAGNSYAVGLDTAGRVRGVNYKNNVFISINGGCIDLDGFGQGTVSGNTCIIPRATDPEYAEDQIGTAAWGVGGVNWVYGAQISNNANDLIVGDSVNISGNTFVNCGGGAVRLYASRNCFVVGNRIDHTDSSVGAPMVIGNIGTGNYQRSYNNIITDNHVSWSPPAQAAIVYENNQYGSFQPGDINWVYNNKITGNGKAYEFKKDTITSSTTKQVFTSAHPAQDRASENYVQREGNYDAGYLRWYSKVSVGNSVVLMSLTDTSVLHLAQDGAAGTGAVATGNRTSIGLMDSVNTGTLFADGMFVLGDSTYTDAKAKLFNGNYALLKFDKANKRVKVSVDVDGSGNRVWSDLGGWFVGNSLTLDALVNQPGFILFKRDTVSKWEIGNTTADLFYITDRSTAVNILEATSNYVALSPGGRVVTVGGGTPDTAAGAPKLQVNGKIKSVSGGFVFPDGTTQVTAASVGGATSILLNNGIGVQWKDTGGTYRDVIRLANDNNVYLENPPATGYNQDIYIRPGYSRYLFLGASSGPSYVAPHPGSLVDLGTTGYRWNYIYAASVNCNTAAYNAIQAVGTGGAGADWGGFLGYSYALSGRATAPPLSGAGTAKMYADASGTLLVSQNGGAYSGLLTSGSNTFTGKQFMLAELMIGGSGYIYDKSGANYGLQLQKWSSDNNVYVDYCVPFSGFMKIRALTANPAGAIADMNDVLTFYMVNQTVNGSTVKTSRIYTGGELIVNGAPASDRTGLSVTKGYIDAEAGYYTAKAVYNAVNLPNGGLYSKIATSALYTQLGQSNGDPVAPAGWALIAGAVTWNTQLSALRVFNGTIWQTVGGSSSGVSQIVAGTGITATPNTGIVTVSVPTINASGTFIGAGVRTSSGVECSGINIYNALNPNAPYNGQTYDIRFPFNFTVGGSSFNTVRFRGGIMTEVLNT